MKSVKCVLTILLTGLFINSDVINSQEIKSVDKWMDYLDELASESEDSERIEALYTDLSYLVEHPLDLNRATAVDWRRLPFLSDFKVMSGIRLFTYFLINFFIARSFPLGLWIL